MARPKSEDKRKAILGAAMRVVAREGLGASTSDIAREAGVPHGSLFTYFGTKAELWNAVYVELREENGEGDAGGVLAGGGDAEPICGGVVELDGLGRGARGGAAGAGGAGGVG